MDERVQQAMQEGIVKLMLAGVMKGCYEKCVTKPSNELTGSEKQCLAMCQDRYQEAYQKTFFRQYERLMKGIEETQNT